MRSRRQEIYWSSCPRCLHACPVSTLFFFSAPLSCYPSFFLVTMVTTKFSLCLYHVSWSRDWWQAVLDALRNGPFFSFTCAWQLHSTGVCLIWWSERERAREGEREIDQRGIGYSWIWHVECSCCTCFRFWLRVRVCLAYSVLLWYRISQHDCRLCFCLVLPIMLPFQRPS